MKKKKKNLHKNAMSILKGFIVEWEDYDPSFEEKELKNIKPSHKNFVHNLCAKRIFEIAKVWMFKDAKAQWSATITTVFSYPTGDDKHHDIIEFYGVFNSINDFAMSIIREQRLKGDASKFSHIEFRAECVDLKPRHISKANPESEIIQIEVAV